MTYFKKTNMQFLSSHPIYCEIHFCSLLTSPQNLIYYYTLSSQIIFLSLFKYNSQGLRNRNNRGIINSAILFEKVPKEGLPEGYIVECNLGWIIRVILELNERAAPVWFEITNMISDQNCTTRGSITTLLHPFWNRANTGFGQFKYLIDAVLSRFEIKFIHFLRGKDKSF